MDAAEDKRRALAMVAKRVAACRNCGLCKGRTNAVPGEGNADADIMFIGEGPGFYEDQQGRPFVGASGKFLDELIGSIGLDRRKVFIANVVKCRPPENRDPQPDEIEACGAYLQEQIDIIDPKIIVTLGRHSMQRYFPGEAISKVHGQPRRKGDTIVVPMYHPAAALHQGSLRKVIEADFAKLPDFLARVLNVGVSTTTPPVPAHMRIQPEPEKPATPRKAAASPTESVASATIEPESQQMRLL